MYQEQDNHVIITMTYDEWNSLLMLMGVAYGHCLSSIPEMLPIVLRLIDSMNEGNPRYTPYGVPAS
jgi:hypothetical protein